MKKITVILICIAVLLIPSAAGAAEIVYRGKTYSVDMPSIDGTFYISAQYNKGADKAEEIEIGGGRYVSLRELAEKNNKYVKWNNIKKNIVISDIESRNDFVYALNSEMAQKGNYVFSPLSIKTALTMAANGANGETRDEILKVLGIEDLEEYNTYAKYLINDYNSGAVNKIKIADSIWVNSSTIPQGINAGFSDTVKNCYNGSASSVKPSEAQGSINKWISAATEGEIKSIDAGAFDVLLLNAVYCDGKWASEFKPEKTYDAEFINADGTKSVAKFMPDSGRYKFYRNSDVSLIALDYRKENDSKDMSMYIAMTDNRDIRLEDYLDRMTDTDVSLRMPKFETESHIDLTEPLKRLEISKAFDNSADFSAMVKGTGIKITDVSHGSKIKVDESGTKAAAYTAVGMLASSARREYEELVINRPFTFFIRDNENGEILFMGRCDHM